MLSTQEVPPNLNLLGTSIRKIQDNRKLPLSIFPNIDVQDTFRNPESTSLYHKNSEMCLNVGTSHLLSTAIKQEPVDFSASSLTPVPEKGFPVLNTLQPNHLLNDTVSVKVEPPSSPSCEEHPSASLFIPPPSEMFRVHESSDCSGQINVETSNHGLENVGFHIDSMTPNHDYKQTPTSEQLSSVGLEIEPSFPCRSFSMSGQTECCDMPSKVPVMRIRRQNSNSLYTASSDCSENDVPLKSLPTSDNLEQFPNSSTSVVSSSDQNGVVPDDLGISRLEDISDDVSAKKFPRKARLKFSPRLRICQNTQVPMQPFIDNMNDISLTVRDKENLNGDENALDKSIFYQWDMSAFPKCVVQLKKLPMNMETVFLTANCGSQKGCSVPSEHSDVMNIDKMKIKDEMEPCNLLDSSALEMKASENSFSDADEGRKRKRSVEPREKARCSFCGMLTLSADVWRHLLAVYKVKDDLKNEKIENQETITCEVCGAGLCSDLALSLHMHHLHTKTDMNLNYKCIICNETFHTQTYLSFHLQTHYCKKQKQRKITKEPQPPDSTSLPQHYECSTCHKTFQRYQALNAHKKLHRQQPIRECQICGKTFMKSYKLKCHMVVHTDERPFKCTECGKSFRFKSSLRSHKFFHMGINPYKCKYCNQGFLEGGNLLKHIRRTHQGHQSEICNICGKVFTDKQALKYHMRIHINFHQRRKMAAQNGTGVKPPETNHTSDSALVKNDASVSPNLDKKAANKDEQNSQASYENSVLFHLLTSPQRDKLQSEGTNQTDNQQSVDLYEWSEGNTDTTSEHDSGMNSPPQSQGECLLCDTTFHTIQKMKKHLLSYHRICPRKLRRLLP